MSQNKHTSRRNFLKNASFATAATLSIPRLVTAAYTGEEGTRKKVSLKRDDVILFQGDSITDAGRKKDEPAFNHPGALGSGYAMIAASGLLYKYADKNLKIYNKGISGNKVYQLGERWQKDCLDLKPNVLSILIGVNDFWHMLNGNYAGTIQTYRNDFIALLERTKKTLPDVKLIIGEPFALPGIKAVNEKWYPAFDEYRNAAREIAKNFDAVFIPYQSIYEKAQKAAHGVYWTHDGVHPSLAGAHLMAHAWLEAVK